MCRSKSVNDLSVNYAHSEYYIDSVYSKIHNNQAFVVIDVGKASIQFKLDTGSQVNIIPLHIYNTIGEVRSLKEPHEKLTSYNCSINTIGYCSLPVNTTTKYERSTVT